MSREPVLAAELHVVGLAKRYPRFSLGPLELAIDDSINVMLGPSGSGKSTLIHLIAGLIQPDRGSISLGGHLLDRLPPERRRVGLVFQDGALFPHLTVAQNVAYGARRDEGPIVELLGIERLLDRRIAGLSGGERRLVALARTLVTDPRALLLDEPLSSLDALAKRRLAGRLRAALEALEIPILYVTHDHDEARRLADRVIVLDEGQVLQSGPFKEVLTRPSSAKVAEFVGLENVLEGVVTQREDGLVTVSVGPVTIYVTGELPVGEAVALILHPEEITLQLEPIRRTSARNVLEGVVRECYPSGPSTQLIRVDCGIELLIQVTDRSAIGLGLAAGVRISASFKATAPLVVARG